MTYRHPQSRPRWQPPIVREYSNAVEQTLAHEQFDLYEHHIAAVGSHDFMFNARAPGVRFACNLLHRRRLAGSIDDVQRPACHWHDNVVVLVTVPPSAVSAGERPTGDTDRGRFDKALLLTDLVVH